MRGADYAVKRSIPVLADLVIAVEAANTVEVSDKFPVGIDESDAGVLADVVGYAPN